MPSLFKVPASPDEGSAPKLPAGTYPAVLAVAQPSRTRGGADVLKVTFALRRPPAGAPPTVDMTVFPDNSRTLFALAQVTGQEGQDEFDLAAMSGTEVVITVEHKPDKTTGRSFARVTGVARPPRPTKVPRPVAPPADEDDGGECPF